MGSMGGFAHALGRGARAFWWSLTLAARRRLVAALAALAAMLVLLVVAAPVIPCQLPGGKHCAPGDRAHELVPAKALAYVHVDLDADRDQLAAAREVFARVPTLVQEAVGGSLDILPGGGGTVAGLIHQVGPWVGEEAALAVLPGAGPGGERAWLLEASDEAGAADFAEVVTAPAEVAEHGGVEVAVNRRRDVAAAMVDGFLVAGTEGAVGAVIDVAAGDSEAGPLADDAAARQARDELPALRFADAYISPEGIDRLLGEGVPASLSPFLAPGATQGAAVALTAADDELVIAIRSALDRDRAESAPGFFAALAPFQPQLPERLRQGSIAYLGFGHPAQTASDLFAQAASDAPGVAIGFEDLLERLRRDDSFDIELDLLPALGDEAALIVETRSGEDLGGIDGVPFVGFVARGVDPDPAREALARLNGPVAAAIDPDAGLQAPVFTDLDVAGVPAQSLRVSPTIELTHAVLDDLAVLATAAEGIERLAGAGRSLAEADAFERATEGFSSEVSLLAFLDLRGLISAAERLGLAADPVYAAFAGEVRALEGLGLAVRHLGDLLATDARLIVGDPTAAPPAAEPPFAAEPPSSAEPPSAAEPDPVVSLESPGDER